MRLAKLSVQSTCAIFLILVLILAFVTPVFSAEVQDIQPSGEKRRIKSLIENLGDRDSAVRRRAARALERLGEPIGRLIYESLEGSQEAGEELAREKDSRALDPLIKALDNVDPSVREAAAATLQAIGDTRATEPLIKLLLEGLP